MDSVNDAAGNNGDETEDPVSHLQEVVDEVDLDSATEEDPLTLDPSKPLFLPPSFLCRPSSTNTRVPFFSPRPLPLRPPRDLIPGLLVRLHSQTLLRCRRPPQPQPEPVLAIGRSAAASAHDTFLQVGQNCQDEGLFGFTTG